MWVKSERPRWPGSCFWRKITSRSGPCSARQARIAAPGAPDAGVQFRVPLHQRLEHADRADARTVLQDRHHLGLEDIGQRVRSAPAPRCRLPRKEGRILGEPISAARLKPVFAARRRLCGSSSGSKSLLWRSVMWRSGTPALSFDSGKPKCCPTGHRRQADRGDIFARRRPETPVGLRPPSVSGRRLPSHPDCRAGLTIVATHPASPAGRGSSISAR